MTQTLIPEGPGPWSKAVAASFVLYQQNWAKEEQNMHKKISWPDVFLPAYYVTAVLPSPDEN